MTASHPTSALRHRNFALLWSGQTISLAGNGVFTVALPLEVLRLTGSPLALSLIVIARTIPAILLLLVGGSLVDRLPRRRVMLVCDLVSGISVGIVAVLIAVGRPHLFDLACLAVVFGTANAFFKPASSAITPDILPPSLYVSASSLSSLSQSLAQFLIGPLLGGFLVTVGGTAWAFGADAASFVVSAACLAAMSRIERKPKSSRRIVEEIGEGLRYCRSRPWLWWSMIAVGISNFACFAPIVVLEPFLVKTVLHSGPLALGVIFAANGVGGGAAALITGRRSEPKKIVKKIWIAWAAAGLCSVLLGLSTTVTLAAISAGALWFFVTYGNILWFPLMQREVPSDLLGRASSVDWMISIGLTPLGIVAGGAAISLIGVRSTLIVGGLVAFAMGLVLFVPGVTEPDREKSGSSEISVAK
ncbi:MAG: MFS transporter [Acidimicrobiaceae bacterium]|nr:MFS transporter [Acidimicrobiaceae bacterium]